MAINADQSPDREPLRFTNLTAHYYPKCDQTQSIQTIMVHIVVFLLRSGRASEC